MKKLLLLAGILAISGAALGVGSDSAQLNVKARIVKPLTVETEALDFGIIAIGSSGYVDDMDAAKSGKVKVTGSPNSTVKLDITDMSGLSTKFGEVTLINSVGSKSDKNNQLIAQLSFNETSENESHGFKDRLTPLNHSVSLNDKGERSIYVGGSTVTVPETQNGGSYTGAMLVTATYEPFGD